jgi:hypothetical protein
MNQNLQSGAGSYETPENTHMDARVSGGRLIFRDRGQAKAFYRKIERAVMPLAKPGYEAKVEDLADVAATITHICWYHEILARANVCHNTGADVPLGMSMEDGSPPVDPKDMSIDWRSVSVTFSEAPDAAP